MTTPPAHASGRDPEALREYEEAFVVLMIESGLPKMMSRVLCYMYMTDSGSVTAAELVEHLQVSPASVSKAVAVLETQALIRRERDERRRERYLVDQDVWYQSMIASAKSAADLAEAARKGVGVLGPGTPAGQRMRNIARFVDFVAESTYRAAEQARDILYEKPATEQEGEPAARQERDAAAGDSAS